MLSSLKNKYTLATIEYASGALNKKKPILDLTLNIEEFGALQTIGAGTRHLPDHSRGVFSSPGITERPKKYLPDLRVRVEQIFMKHLLCTRLWLKT